MSQVSEESLEVLGEKWSCRCGFIGDTAEEVWDHQEAEMWECEESDCSGRLDECDHCPEIATGDAQQEPLVSIHAVRTLFDDAIEHLEAMKCGEEDCEKCIGIDQALTAVRTRRDKLEEFTQNGDDR